MNTLFIHLSPPHQQFSIFYSAAFVAAVLVLIWEGRKRKFPVLPWLLIIIFSQILFITGTKLFALTGEEWRLMLENLELVPAAKKELTGGILLLVGGIWLGKRWLKFRYPVADAFALAIPFGLFLQKWGCFFAGCCFGKLSDLPWAVQYPVMTLPHYQHFQQGIIGAGQSLSLPVHPVQLYEGIGTLLIVFLVWHFGKRWKYQGSSMLFSLSCYLFLRFLVEFLKDPLAHTKGGNSIGPMNLTQWIILILLPVLVFLLFFRENYKKPLTPAAAPTLPSHLSILAFFSFSVLIFAGLSQWFTPVERLVLFLIFSGAAILSLVKVIQDSKRWRYKFVYVFSMVLPFILMGQTLPFPGKDSATIRKTVLVSLGLASGKFDNSNALYQGEGCDRVGNRAYFNQKYVVSGAGLTFTTENPDLKTKTSWGMGFILGSHAESYLSTDTTWNAPKPAPELLPENERKLIWGIHPFLSYDSRWFGIGGGWHMGKLGYSWHWREVEDTGFPYTGRKEVSLFPSLYLRVGPRDVAYADYHLADQFPSAFPGYLHMIGVGTGLGSFNRYSIRLGTLIGGPDRSQGILDIWDIPLLGLYTTGYFPLKNGFALEPLLVFTSAGADGKTDTQFSLGLHYQWNRKK